MATDTRHRIIQWSKEGGWQGGKWGFLLSNLYLFAITLPLSLMTGVGMLLTSLGQGTLPDTDALSSVVVILIAGSIFGYVVGVLPATVAGVVIGTLVGFTSALPTIYISSRKRRIFSSGVILAVGGLLFTVAILLNRGSVIDVLSDGGFWLFVGIPIGVCLVMVMWLSTKLPDLVRESVSVEILAPEQAVPPMSLE